MWLYCTGNIGPKIMWTNNESINERDAELGKKRWNVWPLHPPPPVWRPERSWKENFLSSAEGSWYWTHVLFLSQLPHTSTLLSSLPLFHSLKRRSESATARRAMRRTEMRRDEVFFWRLVFFFCWWSWRYLRMIGFITEFQLDSQSPVRGERREIRGGMRRQRVRRYRCYKQIFSSSLTLPLSSTQKVIHNTNERDVLRALNDF